MYLKHYLNEKGDRVYTLKVNKKDSFLANNRKYYLTVGSFFIKRTSPEGKPTVSSHPARFSPDDQYSRQRIILKKRFGVLLTQSPAPTY